MMANLLRAITLLQFLTALAFSWWLLPSDQHTVLTVTAVTLAVMLLLHLTVIVAEFALAGVVASATPTHFKLSPAGWLRTIFNEFSGSFASFVLRMPLMGATPLPTAPPPTTPRPTAGPIVFVHGYFCNRAIWRPLAAHLAQAGHPIGSVNLEPIFGSIDEYAAVIERELSALGAQHGDQKVTLICHSMGGLAARAYLRRYGHEAIEQIITLGTPHQGTALARHGHGRNVRQMRRDSAWLRELARSETVATGALFTTIFSHHDNIVSPQAEQTIAGAQVIQFGGIGHVSLILNRQVWAFIDTQLAPVKHPGNTKSDAAIIG